MSPKRPHESRARTHTAIRPSLATKARATTAAALTLGAISLFGAAPALAAGTAPTEEPIGLLFVQTASHGTFKPVKGEKHRFNLRLHNPPPQVVWFSDRPARHQGHIPIRGFVRSWAGFGFVADRPNAALTLLRHDDSEDTVVVTLGKPRYHKARDVIRYRARKLPHAGGNLGDFDSDNDGHVPRQFDDASLFIDDATGETINGCLIQPWTECSGAHLASSNLTGARLSSSDFSYALLESSNLSRADLSYADLSYADLSYVNFSGANLYQANFEGADTSHATFCNAILPDGEFDNDDNDC